METSAGIITDKLNWLPEIDPESISPESSAPPWRQIMLPGAQVYLPVSWDPLWSSLKVILLTALHLPAEASTSQGIARVVPDHAPATSVGDGTALGGAGKVVTGPVPQPATPAKASTSKIRVSDPLTDGPFRIVSTIQSGAVHHRGRREARTENISKSQVA